MRENAMIYVTYTDGLSEDVTFNLISKIWGAISQVKVEGSFQTEALACTKALEIGKSLENSRK